MRTNLFKKINNHFIETGSYIGNGIQLALNSGFDNIYSIELADFYYNYCKNRFITLGDKVNLIKGDSIFKLKELLSAHPKINFTFWLDGHHSGVGAGNQMTGFGVKEFPIIEELESILSRDINDEIIYIDDMRILRNFDDKINTQNIINIVKKFKPNSKIYFESSIHDIEDIMVIEY